MTIYYSNTSTQIQQTNKKDEHVEKHKRETYLERRQYFIPYSCHIF